MADKEKANSNAVEYKITSDGRSIVAWWVNGGNTVSCIVCRALVMSVVIVMVVVRKEASRQQQYYTEPFDKKKYG